jgi:hypothetical protein
MRPVIFLLVLSFASCTKRKNCMCIDSSGNKTNAGYAEARTQKAMDKCNENCKAVGDRNGMTCQLE